ncbi:MAG TPA: hypothetical protein VMF32_09210 [Xanthobacteraceae bacterium]|nr:hypothetical protein [Xanthobacteraceae bacterium]
MSVIPLFANQAFDPDQVEILVSAFDDAWDTIKRSGSTFASPRYERGAREIVAEHIVDLARRGVLDRQRLSAEAIAHLANSYGDKYA